MRGISDTIIHGLFSKIEGWPVARVATYRGTTSNNIYRVILFSGGNSRMSFKR